MSVVGTGVQWGWDVVVIKVMSRVTTLLERYGRPDVSWLVTRVAGINDRYTKYRCTPR